MERVQFQQEQMLPELNELVERGLFTENEIRSVMKRRHAFELNLIRRIPRKSDFLQYASYEMELEMLRRKRVARLKLEPIAASLAEYAFVRRQFQIFERALKKFKSDVNLWVQYYRVAQREGATNLVGRICARALQLHPNKPSLYILAASQELKTHSPTAARTLLQRGIRLNPESTDLWKEYLKMEIGFIETLRRRRKVLGLEEGDDGGTQLANDSSGNPIEDEKMSTALIKDEATDDSEAVQREVMNGAVVKIVINNATDAISSATFYAGLRKTISNYPCSSKLRNNLLEHLDQRMRAAVEVNFESELASLYVTRRLTDDIHSEEFIHSLESANDEFHLLFENSLKKAFTYSEAIAKAYGNFVLEWVKKDISFLLKRYLTGSLELLIMNHSSLPLLTSHLRALQAVDTPHERIHKLARDYTNQYSTAAELWLILLESSDFDPDANREKWLALWKEARSKISAENYFVGGELDPHVLQVWLWGIQQIPESWTRSEQEPLYQSLLDDCSLQPALKPLYDMLLVRYMQFVYGHIQLLASKAHGQSVSQAFEKELQPLVLRYTPSASVWSTIFSICAEIESTNEENDQHFLLRAIYDTWRLNVSTSTDAEAEAALVWGGWLIRHRYGREAGEVVARARAALADEDKKADFERRWKRLMDEPTSEDFDDKSSDKVAVEHSDEMEEDEERVTDDDDDKDEDEEAAADVDMLVVS